MDLCRAFQHIKASNLFQASVNTLPSTLHFAVHFAFSILGTAALTIHKALGTCCDRADSTCQIQITLTALIAFIF